MCSTRDLVLYSTLVRTRTDKTSDAAETVEKMRELKSKLIYDSVSFIKYSLFKIENHQCKRDQSVEDQNATTVLHM